MSTAVCRLCGHDPGTPSGVAAQSTAARSRPTSSSAANSLASPRLGSASAARVTGRPLLQAPEPRSAAREASQADNTTTPSYLRRRVLITSERDGHRPSAGNDNFRSVTAAGCSEPQARVLGAAAAGGLY